MTSARDTISFRPERERSPNRAITGAEVKMVSVPRSMVRLDPAICRFTENRAVMVMMPASRFRTFSFTWTRPVKSPARPPTIREAGRVSQGSTPLVISTAVTAAPRGNVPSTPRSGKSRME